MKAAASLLSAVAADDPNCTTLRVGSHVPLAPLCQALGLNTTINQVIFAPTVSFNANGGVQSNQVDSSDGSMYLARAASELFREWRDTDQNGNLSDPAREHGPPSTAEADLSVPQLKVLAPSNAMFLKPAEFAPRALFVLLLSAFSHLPLTAISFSGMRMPALELQCALALVKSRGLRKSTNRQAAGPVNEKCCAAAAFKLIPHLSTPPSPILLPESKPLDSLPRGLPGWLLLFPPGNDTTTWADSAHFFAELRVILGYDSAVASQPDGQEPRDPISECVSAFANNTSATSSGRLPVFVPPLPLFQFHTHESRPPIASGCNGEGELVRVSTPKSVDDEVAADSTGGSASMGFDDERARIWVERAARELLPPQPPRKKLSWGTLTRLDLSGNNLGADPSLCTTLGAIVFAADCTIVHLSVEDCGLCGNDLLALFRPLVDRCVGYASQFLEHGSCYDQPSHATSWRSPSGQTHESKHPRHLAAAEGKMANRDASVRTPPAQGTDAGTPTSAAWAMERSEGDSKSAVPFVQSPVPIENGKDVRGCLAASADSSSTKRCLASSRSSDPQALLRLRLSQRSITSALASTKAFASLYGDADYSTPSRKEREQLPAERRRTTLSDTTSQSVDSLLTVKAFLSRHTQHRHSSIGQRRKKTAAGAKESGTKRVAINSPSSRTSSHSGTLGSSFTTELLPKHLQLRLQRELETVRTHGTGRKESQDDGGNEPRTKSSHRALLGLISKLKLTMGIGQTSPNQPRTDEAGPPVQCLSETETRPYHTDSLYSENTCPAPWVPEGVATVESDTVGECGSSTHSVPNRTRRGDGPSPRAIMNAADGLAQNGKLRDGSGHASQLHYTNPLVTVPIPTISAEPRPAQSPEEQVAPHECPARTLPVPPPTPPGPEERFQRPRGSVRSGLSDYSGSQGSTPHSRKPDGHGGHGGGIDEKRGQQHDTTPCERLLRSGCAAVNRPAGLQLPQALRGQTSELLCSDIVAPEGGGKWGQCDVDRCVTTYPFANPGSCSEVALSNSTSHPHPVRAQSNATYTYSGGTQELPTPHSSVTASSSEPFALSLRSIRVGFVLMSGWLKASSLASPLLWSHQLVLTLATTGGGIVHVEGQECSLSVSVDPE